MDQIYRVCQINGLFFESLFIVMRERHYYELHCI